jgi:hypothetical protein
MVGPKPDRIRNTAYQLQCRTFFSCQEGFKRCDISISYSNYEVKLCIKSLVAALHYQIKSFPNQVGSPGSVSGRMGLLLYSSVPTGQLAS